MWAKHNQLADIRGDLKLVQWMSGAAMGISLLTLGSIFALWWKVGEISGQLAQVLRAASH